MRQECAGGAGDGRVGGSAPRCPGGVQPISGLTRGHRAAPSVIRGDGIARHARRRPCGPRAEQMDE